MNNYPAGVGPGHPYFNPPTCEECGEEGAVPGENCEECGAYVPSESDYADEAAERRRDTPR